MLVVESNLILVMFVMRFPSLSLLFCCFTLPFTLTTVKGKRGIKSIPTEKGGTGPELGAIKEASVKETALRAIKKAKYFIEQKWSFV